MVEEIKEILDSFTKFKDKWYSCEYILKPEQCILLLDYITNLQQENEKLKYNARGQVNDYFKDKYTDEVLKNAELKKENEELNRMCELYSKSLYNAELTDYKSRFEKAMEVLKLPIVYETHQENGERDELLKKIRQAKDILNGSDENE